MQPKKVTYVLTESTNKIIESTALTTCPASLTVTYPSCLQPRCHSSRTNYGDKNQGVLAAGLLHSVTENRLGKAM